MGLPFDSSIAPDGTCYSDMGDGEVIVCLHGLGLDRTMWEPLAAALAGQYRLICVDLIGHGGSASPAQGATLADFTRQLDDLMNHLKIDEADVLGFDLGGQVAIGAVAEQPERYSRLVLINTAYRRLKAQRDMMLRRVQQARKHGPAANADSAIQRWFSAAFQAEHKDVVEQIRERVAGNDPQGYLIASEVYAWADVATADLVKNIQCPTLVMCGALDMGTTPAMTRRLADAISQSKLIIVPRQRHMLPMEAPDVVADAMRNFR